MYFAGRGCGAAAAELASQTLARAAEKFATADAPLDRAPTGYLLQVASFILLEHLRTRKMVPLDPHIAAVGASESDEPVRVRCCKDCLSQFSAAERDLMHDYYLGREKGEAKRIRLQVAGDLGMAQGAHAARPKPSKSHPPTS